MNAGSDTSGQRIFAEPRPAMRGRYLIRNARSARIATAVDAVLALSQFARSPVTVPSQPRRIVVADWAHLGNVLLALPTLAVLRARFPATEIGFLGGTWSGQILEGTGLCDHLHLVDHFGMSRVSVSQLARIRRFRAMRRRAVRDMRALSYNIAIDLSGHYPPVGPLFYAAGIPVRAGFTSGGYGPLLTHPVSWIHTSRPISDYPRDLLRALWPDMALPEEDFRPCYPGHPRGSLPRELEAEPYVLLHMGSGGAFKEWSEAHWRAVGASLAAEGRRLVLAGSGTREVERVHRIAAALSGKVTVLIDRSWVDYVTSVARADHVICLDSSSAHIAAAFSVPTTVIYPGLTDPVQWGPYNRQARILTAPVGCAPCHRMGGCEAMACIRDVSPESVLDAVRSALTDAAVVG